MRHGFAIGVAAAAVLGTVTGCDSQQGASDTADTPSSATSAAPAGPPPPQPEPVRTADCPYLDTVEVEQRNGQLVGEVKISAGRTPSCFFYRPDGERQLRTRVFSGQLDTARAVVDQAAPIKTSARASLPGGWEGGEQPLGTGSVYTVAKPTGDGRGTAVVVHSNQAQSVKGRELAKLIIRTLDL